MAEMIVGVVVSEMIVGAAMGETIVDVAESVVIGMDAIARVAGTRIVGELHRILLVVQGAVSEAGSDETLQPNDAHPMDGGIAQRRA
jgi:hypothetical protein